MNTRQPGPPADGWRTQAACTGQDPRLFTDPRPGTDDTRQAITTCQRCPVREPCLTEALTHPTAEDVGIWGATTPDQRIRLRHKQPSIIAARPAPEPETFPLFHTLEGDLTDLTGRALVTRLPTGPHQMLFIDNRPVLRTDDVTDAWHHIINTIDDYQPAALAPFVLSDHGELIDPTGRITITRLPVQPHLLVVHDDQPTSRHRQLAEARRAALTRSRAPDRDSLATVLAPPSDTRSVSRPAARR